MSGWIHCWKLARSINRKTHDMFIALPFLQIPHHQNAVNMAKSLLKSNILDCPDVTNEENQDCVLESVIRSIIVDQNHQIQLMRGYLEANEYPEKDDCVVSIQDGGSGAAGLGLVLTAVMLAATTVLVG